MHLHMFGAKPIQFKPVQICAVRLQTEPDEDTPPDELLEDVVGNQKPKGGQPLHMQLTELKVRQPLFWQSFCVKLQFGI